MKISAASHVPAASTATSQLQPDQARLAADTRSHADAARIAADKAAVAADQRATAKGSSIDTHL